jgi:hypothetical protein
MRLGMQLLILEHVSNMQSFFLHLKHVVDMGGHFLLVCSASD